MKKEEVMLQKRLIELSKISYQRDIVTFSDLFCSFKDAFITIDNISWFTNPFSMLFTRFDAQIPQKSRFQAISCQSVIET